MEVSKLRTHPRIIEVRFVMIYHRIHVVLGEERTRALMKHVCEENNLKYVIIKGMIDSITAIMGKTYDAPMMKRQEYIVAAEAWGETRSTVAEKDLGITSAYIYQNKKIHNSEVFVTDEWIRRIDQNASVARVETWYHETIRFLEILQDYLTIM